MIFYPHFLTSKNDQYLTSTPLIIPKSVYVTSKSSHGLLIAIFENTKTWIYFQSQKICLYQLQDVLRSSKYLICNGKNVFFGEIYHWYLRIALYHLEIDFGYFLINIQPSNFVEIPLKIITFSPIGWPIFTFFFQKLTATFKKSPFYTTWDQQEIMYFSVKKNRKYSNHWRKKCFWFTIFRPNFKV